jgi:hypothetical protein
MLQKEMFITPYIEAVEKQLDKLNELARGLSDRKTETLLVVVACASLLGAGLQVLSVAKWFGNFCATISGGLLAIVGFSAAVIFWIRRQKYNK